MSGMQYKDLKVGDIIKSLEDGLAYYVIDLSNSTIMRIGSEPDALFDAWRCLLSDAEPIPLSEGLLNKIGSIDHFGLGLSFKFKKARVCSFDNKFEFQSKNTKKKIKYLHELQHELWDEGINIKFNVIGLIDN